MTVGTDGDFPLNAQGRTYGVDVRGNVVHDLRGVAQGGLWERGLGMALTTPDAAAVPAQQFNRVYRNAVANTPGDTFYVGSRTNPLEYAHSFAVRNNLIAWNGSGGNCKARIGTYPDDHRDNYWIDALSPPSTPTRPEFARPGIQPFRSPFIPSAQVSCGSILADPLTPDQYVGLRYDYRLTPGQLEDVGGVDPAFGEPYTGETEMCGTGFDIGPRERCGDDRKVYLREHTTASGRDDEIFSGEWWGSPDIGIWENDGATPYVPVGGETPLRQDTPYFKRNRTTTSKLLVRVRSDNPPAPTEPIHIRLWGAPIHTSISFPREFTPYVDEDVYWADNSPRLIDSGPNWRVYAIPWKVEGAKHPAFQGIEHFCLRAEVSTRFDRKPPFMTPIERSNNLVQRNVAIEREPVRSLGIPFLLADVREELIIESKLERGRRAYLYFPETAARVWQGRGRRRALPRGRLVPLRAGRRRAGRSVIRPRRTRLGTDVAQLIVDSRKARIPSASEVIAVRQEGRSGFRIRLNRRGFRDSFEWGFRRRWRASGAWNVVDRDRHRCGTSRLGRRAAGFVSPRRCRLARRRHRGTLTSPRLRVPRRQRGPVGVTFFHRSLRANRRGVVREVWVSTARRMKRVRRWTRRNHGRRGNWDPVYIDLRRFRGKRVRLRFRMRVVGASARRDNRSPAWFIDDIAVN